MYTDRVLEPSNKHNIFLSPPQLSKGGQYATYSQHSDWDYENDSFWKKTDVAGANFKDENVNNGSFLTPIHRNFKTVDADCSEDLDHNLLAQHFYKEMIATCKQHNLQQDFNYLNQNEGSHRLNDDPDDLISRMKSKLDSIQQKLSLMMNTNNQSSIKTPLDNVKILNKYANEYTDSSNQYKLYHNDDYSCSQIDQFSLASRSHVSRLLFHFPFLQFSNYFA